MTLSAPLLRLDTSVPGPEREPSIAAASWGTGAYPTGHGGTMDAPEPRP